MVGGEERKIYKNQNGFRRKSCVDNLVKLTADIEIMMKENSNTIAAFLDVSSAYDNVRKDILIPKLLKERCPKNLVRYINQWMKNRKTKFVISQEEEWRAVNKSRPQGEVLSQILYALYTNEIHQGVDYRCQLLQYADDIAVCSMGRDKDISIKEVGTAVK